MNDHERAVRMAALDLDFPLSLAERRTLDAHLAGCTDCRRALARLVADAGSLREIASATGRPEVRAAFSAAVDRPDHVGVTVLTDVRPWLRLAAVAALLALLAAGLALAGLMGSRGPSLATTPTDHPTVEPSIRVATALVELTVAGCPATWLAPSGSGVLAVCSGTLTHLEAGYAPRTISTGVRAATLTGDTIWAVGTDTLIRLNATVESVTGRFAGAGGDVVAADGRDVWVARTSAGMILRVDAGSGRTLATIAVGLDPEGILLSAGRVWVTNRGSDTVSEIDPATNTVARVIPVGAGPFGLTATDGTIWVANDADGTLSEIDATTGAATPVDIDPKANTSILPAIAAQPDGSIWVVDGHTQELVGVSAAGGSVTQRWWVPGIRPVGTRFTALAAGDSVLWLEDSSGTLWKISAP